MTRTWYYLLLAAVAAVGLWFVADTRWGTGGDRAAFRGPLAPLVDEAAVGRSEWVPCTRLSLEQQDALAYGGNRPAESCRIESADTTVVALRAADSTVISVVRVWRPGAGRLDAEYQTAADELTREWGTGLTCPENDQRGAAGDRVWSRAGRHVRLYQRLPDQLVIDHELGEGGCQIPR